MTTLQSSCEFTGVGLHSGAKTIVKIAPAPVGKGRYFVRTDLPNTPEIPASVEHVSQTTLSTELTANDASIRTVEHLLAALFALGITDARIEVNGPELPLLDGSAREWVAGIQASGIQPSPVSPVTTKTIDTPIWVRDGDIFVAAIPSPDLRFTYGIDFDLAPIGNQWHSWQPQKEDFVTQVAPARTFGFAHQIEQLRQAGLIKGGSLDNALVCSDREWLNPPLRFPNEPARHKLLDLIGDLSLLGTRLPTAHYLAYKASHDRHVKLARQILAAYLSPLVDE
jgi:UDP-3-O-[3-hydroxymyristoyl] N-acetylglucosamine deacetylase